MRWGCRRARGPRAAAAPEQLAPRVDALDPDAALEIRAEAAARVEDAGDAQGRLEACPLQVGRASHLSTTPGSMFGILGRVHRPELQVHAEEPLARPALLRDADVPIEGLLEHVAVLAVSRAEAEGSVDLPGGRGRRVGRRWRGSARSRRPESWLAGLGAASRLRPRVLGTDRQRPAPGSAQTSPTRTRSSSPQPFPLVVVP